MIIFLGDSITEFGNWQSLLPNFDIVNYGVSGDKTYQVVERVDKLFNKKANKLFLLIGINDLSDNRPFCDIEMNYRKLLNLLLENDIASEIILVSILPFRTSKYSKPGFYLNNVYQLNNLISSIAKENNLIFVDIHSSFADINGELKDELTDDGLHLSYKGYDLYKKLIKKYL